jgi:hypothetical protein
MKDHEGLLCSTAHQYGSRCFDLGVVLLTKNSVCDVGLYFVAFVAFVPSW